MSIWDWLFKRRPKPTPTPAMQYTEVNIWVRDAQRGSPIPDAPIDVFDPEFPLPEDGRTNQDGFFRIRLPRRSIVIEVHADGYQSATKVVTVTASFEINFTLEPIPVPVPVYEAPAELHVDGPLLRRADGKIQRIKYVTAFDAGRRVHVKDWDTLKKYAKWTREVGGNGWRVFGGWSRTSFDFRTIPDYFTRVLPDLSLFMKDEGLGGEFVCICDGIPEALSEQHDFVLRCMEALARYFLIAEANEPWKNKYDPQQHIYITDRLMTKGAPEAGTWPWPYVPSRGFSVHHSPRDEQWARKFGKDSYEIRGTTRDVVFEEEGPGFSENLKAWSRVNNENHAFVAGVGSGMFSPGLVAHGDTDTAQMCIVPGPQETLCFKKCFEGVDFVPLEAPTWLYARYGPSNPGVPMPVQDDVFPAPGRLTDHMHAMIGPGKAIVCNYYPSNGWIALPANGWRIVEQRGGAVLCSR